MRQGQDTYFLQLVLRQLVKLGQGLQQFSLWADRRPVSWQGRDPSARLARCGSNLMQLAARALLPGQVRAYTQERLSTCRLDNGLTISLRRTPSGSRPGLSLCVQGPDGRLLMPDEYYWLPHEVSDTDLPALACRIAPWVARAIVELSLVTDKTGRSAHAA